MARLDSVKHRIAAAPISWGVCEVPGWGHQLDAARVLTEMRALGLTATELGPDGFLPADPVERAALFASYGLRLAGGFAPVVLHDPSVDPSPVVDRLLATFGPAVGTTPVVLAAGTGRTGYDTRPDLSEESWETLLANLDLIAARLRTRGVLVTLHPHVGTLVENLDEVVRVLEGSTVQLCLDTGHLLIGGVDPLWLARAAATRIAHVHLKDVDAVLAESVRTGELTYAAAVRAGLYRPLGGGDVDIAGVVRTLEAAGYDGWYVLEQDTILDAEPPPGGGPGDAVRASIAFLAELTA